MVWVTGMALGVIFIELKPGYAPELFSYLFGSIITVPRSDILLMAFLDLVIIAVVILFYKELFAISFDEEFATAIGVPVEFVYLLLLSLIALTVVVLIRMIGVVLVIAMLTIPAAISGYISYDLKEIIILSSILSATFIVCGLYISYIFNVASGATIVLVSVSVFTATLIIKRLRSTSNKLPKTLK